MVDRFLCSEGKQSSWSGGGKAKNATLDSLCVPGYTENPNSIVIALSKNPYISLYMP